MNNTANAGRIVVLLHQLHQQCLLHNTPSFVVVRRSIANEVDRECRWQKTIYRYYFLRYASGYEEKEQKAGKYPVDFPFLL